MDIAIHICMCNLYVPKGDGVAERCSSFSGEERISHSPISPPSDTLISTHKYGPKSLP